MSRGKVLKKISHSFRKNEKIKNQKITKKIKKNHKKIKNSQKLSKNHIENQKIKKFRIYFLEYFTPR